jgi:DNA-binding PadR family transcriptional regulator
VISKVELVALGLLAEEPMHGYDLLLRYRSLAMDLWAQVGKASVYQALRRLEDQGLITGRSQEGTEGPERRVYRLSRAGRDALAGGLVERFATDEAPLALGFSHLLPASALKRCLDTRDAALRNRLDAIAASRSKAGGVAARMLDREAAIAGADLAWLSSFRRSRR